MKILLATDGNEPALACETLLARMADRERVAVQVLAINSFETVMAEARVLQHYDPAAARERLRGIVEAAVERLRASGLRADGGVEDGHAATGILAAAERDGSVDLIAVGAGHTRWLDTLLLGSTSTEVLHSAPCPVLIVHETASDDGKLRVMVGTDGSPGAQAAIASLVALADPARCSVSVVAVASTSALSFSMAGDSGIDGFVACMQDVASVAATEAAGTLRGAGFEDVAIEVVAGNPASTLLERARRHDLAVVGCRGLGALRRKAMGSVSDRVVRHAAATLVGRDPAAA
jgi:nucleotide-binding universal stress UspA family protein